MTARRSTRSTHSDGLSRPACVALIALLAGQGCDASERPADDVASATQQGDTAAPPDTADAADATPEQQRRLAATGAIVEFLRGAAPLDTTLLADSVTLHIAPEGGGDSVRIAARALRERVAWRVAERNLLPFAGAADMSARHGVHYNCLEYPLASRHPGLARKPHVGVRLQGAGAAGCLGTWNMTFVFDDLEAPRLTAVVYDQWEW